MTTKRKPTKPKRPLVRIEVVRNDSNDFPWAVICEGVPCDSYIFKHRSIDGARRLARALARRGCTVEVEPRDEYGRYVKSERATYPRSADPRRRKG